MPHGEAAENNVCVTERNLVKEDFQMLVLRRQENEVIEIGCAGMVLTGPIKVMVVRAVPGGARLGFDCQKDLPIHRSEIADRIRQQVGEGK